MKNEYYITISLSRAMSTSKAKLREEIKINKMEIIDNNSQPLEKLPFYYFLPGKSYPTMFQTRTGYIVNIIGHDVNIYDPETEKIVKTFKAERAFLAHDPTNTIPRNSVLLQIGELEYIFVNEVVFKFKTVEPILEFHGHNCGADAPYCSALTKSFVYVLQYSVYYDRKYMCNPDDENVPVPHYEFYYENDKGPRAKLFVKYETEKITSLKP